MASIQNKVIHRFIRPIEDYMVGGSYYTQIIPVDTQAYAYYSEESTEGNQTGLWYVFGDGNHTYLEIKEGKGDVESAKEYPVLTADIITLIEQKADKATTYTKNEVDQLIAEIPSFHIEIVDELPETGYEGILYLVPDKEKEETEENFYYEYIWANNKWELIGNTSGSIDPKDLVAEKIKYNYGSITNVQQALDLLMSYQPTITPGEDKTEEIGSVLQNVTLSWEINKPMASITIQPGNIQVDPTATEYTIENANLDETTTYTIYFNDGKNTYTTKQTFTFASKLYNGTSAEENPDNEEILDFNQTFETSDKPTTYDFDCSGGKYFFICLTEDKANKVVFKINGFIFTDYIETRKEVTNASGYTTTYSIFRSKNLQHSNDIPVEISYND